MVALLFSAVLLLSGCGLFPGGVVTLYTDKQEIAAYAETFNAAQNSHRLEIQFKEDPSKAAAGDASPPDLVITDNIAGKTSLGRYRSLNKLFDKKRLTRDSFYSSLLAMGQKDKQQVLVPISFDLPILMFDTHIPGEETSAFLLNLDTVQEHAARHNKNGNGGFSVMGFAPRWNPDFLLHSAAMLGADFTEGSDSILAWNDRALRQAVDYLRTWSETRNGGPAAESQYEEKYLYDPPYRQVSLGRAKFAYTSVADFFMLPENRRLSLDFRWLAHKNKILALDRILFAGIPVRGKNPRGAEAFLRWLLDSETQKHLLESARRKMTHVFGIASGLSSLRSVNENEFPRFYPHLSGHIPPEDSLTFPPAVPDNWDKIKEQVLMPWLLRQTAGTGEQEDLRPLLRIWLQQQTF